MLCPTLAIDAEGHARYQLPAFIRDVSTTLPTNSTRGTMPDCRTIPGNHHLKQQFITGLVTVDLIH
jgi:hypothetical protein